MESLVIPLKKQKNPKQNKTPQLKQSNYLSDNPSNKHSNLIALITTVTTALNRHQFYSQVMQKVFQVNKHLQNNII